MFGSQIHLVRYDWLSADSIHYCDERARMYAERAVWKNVPVRPSGFQGKLLGVLVLLPVNTECPSMFTENISGIKGKLLSHKPYVHAQGPVSCSLNAMQWFSIMLQLHVQILGEKNKHAFIMHVFFYYFTSVRSPCVICLWMYCPSLSCWRVRAKLQPAVPVFRWSGAMPSCDREMQLFTWLSRSKLWATWVWRVFFFFLSLCCGRILGMY